MRRQLLSLAFFACLSSAVFPQSQDPHQPEHPATDSSAHHESGEEFDPGATAFHHISDANAFHVFGGIFIPLPCILYAPGQGWSVFSSSKFHIHGHHGDGQQAVDRYVLVGGSVQRVADASFPAGEVALEGEHPFHATEETTSKGKKKEVYFLKHQGKDYRLDKKSTLDGGVLGGGLTSFYDFSITKNVATMLLTVVLLFWLFRSAAVAYKRRQGQAPKGVQGFLEPIFLFIQDEVAKPFLGHKHERYLPFLLTVFFFILGLNLIGQIPFFPGSANVTGNLGVTLVLALITFLIVTFSGNRHYWQHIFWMPGIPAWVKTILTPVEVMGVFIKPVTLMMRLFANITAGHMVILCFVSLIFIFGKAGESIGGATVGALVAVPLTLFMMAIELLVAFIQAFVFCTLAASYIGAATEEPHHH